MTLYRIDAQVGDAWMPALKDPVRAQDAHEVLAKYTLAYPNLALRIVPVRVLNTEGKNPRQKNRR